MSGTSTSASATAASTTASSNSRSSDGFVLLGQALADVLAKLGERVEPGGLGGEVVVGLGQVLGLDLVDRDRELRLLAGQLRYRIVLGEGDRDRALVAGARAHQLLLEPGHEPARPELEQLIAAGAALELLSADGSDVVHDDVVAVLGRALHGVERRHPVAQPFDLGVDLGVLDLRLAPADLEALVFAELGGGPHADLDRELERLALGRQLVRDVQLGLTHGRDAGLVDRVRVPPSESAPERLVEDGVAAEPTDHYRRRDLALAEAGDPHLAAELARGLLDAALDLLGRDLRLDAYARFGKLGDACLDAGGHSDRCETIAWTGGFQDFRPAGHGTGRVLRRRRDRRGPAARGLRALASRGARRYSAIVTAPMPVGTPARVVPRSRLRTSRSATGSVVLS